LMCIGEIVIFWGAILELEFADGTQSVLQSTNIPKVRY
jgi:hypothetical protein